MCDATGRCAEGRRLYDDYTTKREQWWEVSAKRHATREAIEKAQALYLDAYKAHRDHKEAPAALQRDEGRIPQPTEGR